MSQQIGNDNDNTFRSPKRPDSTLTPSDNFKSEKIEPVSEAKDLEKEAFLERWKNNRFWLIKGSYYLLRSVWMIVMTIGGIIVWLISLLFI